MPRAMTAQPRRLCHQVWALGLTPRLFWKHRSWLLEPLIDAEECEARVLELVKAEGSKVCNGKVTDVMVLKAAQGLSTPVGCTGCLTPTATCTAPYPSPTQRILQPSSARHAPLGNRPEGDWSGLLVAVAVKRRGWRAAEGCARGSRMKSPEEGCRGLQGFVVGWTRGLETI